MSKRDTSEKTLLETLKDKVRKWVEAVDEALAPPPELVPVPVRNHRRR